VAPGGKVAMPVTMAQFEDPEGHLIEIIKAGSM
jgi:hypothetical protein